VFDKLEAIKQRVYSKKNMDLKLMLENIAELENLVENHKQKLVNECKDYNTIDAFRQ